MTGHWRTLLFIANCFGIPGALLLAAFVESPRYLMQQKKYKEVSFQKAFLGKKCTNLLILFLKFRQPTQ